MVFNHISWDSMGGSNCGETLTTPRINLASEMISSLSNLESFALCMREKVRARCLVEKWSNYAVKSKQFKYATL